MFLAILGAGIAVSFIAFRFFRTETVTLVATADLQPVAEGARCGDVHFLVEPRTKGEWFFRLEQGQGLSALIAVEGNEAADIGLRITSPNNRPVYANPKRLHERTIELAAPIRGDYLFEFDNRHSTFTEKQLTVSICVT